MNRISNRPHNAATRHVNRSCMAAVLKSVEPAIGGYRSAAMSPNMSETDPQQAPEANKRLVKRYFDAMERGQLDDAVEFLGTCLAELRVRPLRTAVATQAGEHGDWVSDVAHCLSRPP